MSFGWLGTFRQGSWRIFRRFVLEERRDIGERIAVIQAELSRIGEITVLYASTTDGEGNTVVSEEREGFLVTEGSSLGKLIQAYVALGGNPFDISMFLTPDAVVTLDSEDTSLPGTETQPYQGVVYAKSASYNLGGLYEGGYLSYTKYVPARVGGRRELEDYGVAAQVRKARKWVNPSIRYKRNDLEARIIKLCDLREQLLQELQDIVFASAGVTATSPYFDTDQFSPNLSVAAIVSTIDSLFYEVAEDGTADFDSENEDALGNHPHLLSDILPDEKNTAL